MTHRKLLCRLIGHRWSGSAWNPWVVEVEQRCERCGDYQHVPPGQWVNKPIDAAWHYKPGPHPVAQQLRDDGKTQSDDWTGAWGRGADV